MFLSSHGHVALTASDSAEHAARASPHRPRSELRVGAWHICANLEVGVFEALCGGGALVWVPFQGVLDELESFSAGVGEEGLEGSRYLEI